MTRPESGIGEADWRLFTVVKDRALDRYCRGALDEARALADAAGDDAPERFAELVRLARERDREVRSVFDGHARSRAWLQLARLASLGLLEDADIAGFSETVRADIERARAANRGR